MNTLVQMGLRDPGGLISLSRTYRCTRLPAMPQALFDGRVAWKCAKFRVEEFMFAVRTFASIGSEKFRGSPYHSTAR